MLRNNRSCPVCKRRVLPGDSDSENEESSSSTTNADSRRILSENEPNEDDDTNESSRLLINNNDNTNRVTLSEDNSSLLTTSTNVHNLTSMSNLTTNFLNNNNEISSLNNHMTTSISSSQLQNRGDLATSSSKYGSISSINQADTSNSQTHSNGKQQGADLAQIDQNDDENRTFTFRQEAIVDSKQTPEYFSVTSDIGTFGENEVEAGTSSSPFVLNNFDKEMQLKTISKKNSNLANVNNQSETSKRTLNNKLTKKASKSNTKPITNINLSKIAAKLEEERHAKREDDVDVENFQSVEENDLNDDDEQKK